jgi:hypothetical protein
MLRIVVLFGKVEVIQELRELEELLLLLLLIED